MGSQVLDAVGAGCVGGVVVGDGIDLKAAGLHLREQEQEAGMSGVEWVLCDRLGDQFAILVFGMYVDDEWGWAVVGEFL